MTIKVEFSDLTSEQAEALIGAYREITSGTRAAAAPGRAEQVSRAAAELVQTEAAAAAQPAVPAPTPGRHASVPAAQPAAPASAASGEPDAFGVPYNPALHATRDGPTGGRNKDGSWRAKKQVNREAYLKWQEDHRAAANAAPREAVRGPTADQLNSQFGAPPVAQAPAAAPQAGVPFPGPATPPAFTGFGTAAAAPAPIEYADFVRKCNEMVGAGLMTPTNVARIKRAAGSEKEDEINRDPGCRARAHAEMLRIEAELQPA